MGFHSAASIFPHVTRHDHIRDYLKAALHWLPYPLQVKFCVLKAVALSVIGAAPSFLSELLHPLSSVYPKHKFPYS